MLHVWLETNFAQSPMKFISIFGNHRKVLKKSDMKSNGVAKNVITKATVKIGIIKRFMNKVKNETPLKFERRIGRIKNWDEMVVASGPAIHFGITNFLIGFLKNLNTLLPNITIPITHPKLS